MQAIQSYKHFLGRYSHFDKLSDLATFLQSHRHARRADRVNHIMLVWATAIKYTRCARVHGLDSLLLLLLLLLVAWPTRILPLIMYPYLNACVYAYTIITAD